jgi:quinol monooxygenase YgiN
MFIVHVDIAVLPDHIGDFIEATLENARASLQEPGIARFDLVQRLDDPGIFTLVEVYRDERAPVAHKATAHYARWAEAVAPMMARPRQSLKYRNLFPGEAGWDVARPGGES